MPAIYSQTVDEKLDYGIDYSGRLPTGDNLAATVWTVPAGLTSSAPTYSGQTASVFLTGGTLGTDYTVRNKSTSAAGRIVEDSIVIQVR